LERAGSEAEEPQPWITNTKSKPEIVRLIIAYKSTQWARALVAILDRAASARRVIEVFGRVGESGSVVSRL
jgi:hypothetical protein